MRIAISILFIILGAAGYGGSMYIQKQIIQGEAQIKSAQKKVGQAEGLLSLTPYTDPIGKGLSSSADKKIKEGQAEITYYSEIAQVLKFGGIISFSIGVIGLLFFRKKKK